MAIRKNVFIGHVETINPNVLENQKFTESKVVALQLVNFNNNKKVPTYKPLRKYKEYYKILSVEPMVGYVTDMDIDKKIQEIGKPEVKVLKKVA